MNEGRVRGRKRIPRQLYRRITAFMLTFVMVFSNLGSNVYTAYGAVTKEKVKVHAQISSEAVIDTLIASGGYGIDFDNELGDMLMSESKSDAVSETIYDELMETLEEENSHLIAQRAIGGLGLFLIAVNDVEDTSYPETVELEEEETSKKVFTLYSKGRVIKEEYLDEIDFDDEDPESWEEEFSEDADSQEEVKLFGGTAKERQMIADSIKKLVVVAVNFNADTIYDVTVSLTDDTLSVLEAELVTTTYKEKTATSENNISFNGGNSAGTEPETVEKNEVTTAPAEDGNESVKAEETTEAETSTETEETTEAEKTTETETPAEMEQSTEAEIPAETEESVVPSETEESSEAVQPTEESVLSSEETAGTTESAAEKIESTSGDTQVSDMMEGVEPSEEETQVSETQESVEETSAESEPISEEYNNVTVERNEVAVLQTALTISTEDGDRKSDGHESEVVIEKNTEPVVEESTESKKPEISESVSTSEPEKIESSAATEPETEAETEESGTAETTEPETAESKTTETTEPETADPETEETEKATEAPVITETTESATEPDKQQGSNSAGNGNASASSNVVKADDNEEEEADKWSDDESEVKSRTNKTTLKKSEIKQLLSFEEKKASTSEVSGGYKISVKPYIFTALSMEMESNLPEILTGDLVIKNTGIEPVFYHVQLSNEESSEPVPYTGPASFYFEGDETGLEDEISEGGLYLPANSFAVIKELPQKTAYVVEIVPVERPQMLAMTVEEESGSEESVTAGATFADGSTRASGTIGSGTILESRQENGQFLVTIKDYDGKPLEGVTVELYRTYSSESGLEDLKQSYSSGNTDRDGQVLLNYNNKSSYKKEYYYVCINQMDNKILVAQYSKGKDSKKVELKEKYSSNVYEIDAKPEAYSSDKPTITLTKKQGRLSITPVIQGLQTDDSFTFTLKNEDGTAAAGKVTVNDVESEIIDGKIRLSAGETAIVQTVNPSVKITAQPSDSYVVNRIIKNGSLIAERNTPVVYDSNKDVSADLAFSFRAVGENDGGTEVTKQAIQTETPGLYDVTLTVKGEPTRIENTGNVDVLLVIDLSGSMSYAMNRKWQVSYENPKRFDLLKSAVADMTASILGTQAKSENSIAAIGYNTEFTLISNWTNNADSINKAISRQTPEGSTNCQLGFIKADEMLDSISDRNTQKFVVYLSDGDPNRYVNDVGTGNATERAVYSAKQLRQNHPEVTIMTLGVSSDPGTDVLAPTGEDRYWDMYAQASDKDKFTNAFKAITDIIEQKYERPVVRDEMGSNVRFVENSMRTWKTTENADSSEGTASYDEQSRTITWDVINGPEGDELKKGNLYTLTYQVEVINELLPMEKTGEPHTGTHENQSGWWSNEKAELFCNDSDTFATNVFPKPVVQKTASADLYLEKVDDADNSIKLAGAEFSIYRKNSITDVWDRLEKSDETDANGKLKLTGLTTGIVYKLVETKTPVNYTGTYSTFIKAVIEKEEVHVYECTEQGMIASDAAPITEISPLIITNVKQLGDITITKNVTVNNNVTSGTLADGTYYFALYDESGVTRVTDVKSITIQNGNAGSVSFTDIPTGNYKIYEVFQDGKGGYTKETPEGITVTPRDGELAEVSSAGTVSVLFTNDKAVTGNVSLLKTDGNGKKLQGAEFTLYRIDQNSGYTEIGVYTTDKDGIINISSLEFGEYKLEETKAPSGYELDEAWVQFFTVSDQNGEQNYSFEVTNREIQGYAKITKTFSDTSLSVEDKIRLASEVKIGVYRKNSSNEEVEVEAPRSPEVDGAGNITLTVGPLAAGSYYFKETASPEEYLVDSEEKIFTISASNTKDEPVIAKTIENTKISASVTFGKIDGEDKSTIEGASFKLYKVEEEAKDTYIDTYASDSKGIVTASGLGKGTYYFVEDELAGYEKNNTKYYFTISSAEHGQTIKQLRKNGPEGEIVSLVENTRKMGKVTAVKVDKDGKKPLAGAEFTLYVKDAEATGFIARAARLISRVVGNTDGYTQYGTNPYVTDDKGILNIPNLPWNEYRLVETKAPKGYKKIDTPFDFTIDEKQTEVSLGINGEITNEKQKGSVILTKTGAGDTPQPLAGAEFELYKVGQETAVRTGLVTKADGKIEVNGLDWGTYYFKEVKAPSGYILAEGESAKSEQFVIDADDADSDNIMVSEQITMSNTPMTGNLLIKKEFDGKSVTESGITEEELSQVTFDVYRKDETTGDSRVNTEPLKLRPEGTVLFGPLSLGKYYVVETGAPDRYPINLTKYEFVIDESNYNQEHMVVVNNTLFTTNVTVRKIDADAEGKGIKNANFNLYRSGSTEIYQSVTSTEDGSVTFNGLGTGTYYFTEVSNTGYEISDTQYYFKVTRETKGEVTLHKDSIDGETITGSDIPNNRKTASVVLTKRDSENTELVLPGAEFSLYREDEPQALAERLTTNESGKITYDGLTWGKYYFTETKAPYGYKLNTGKIEFTIERDTFAEGKTECTVDAFNEKYYGKAVLTKKFIDVSNQELSDINGLTARFNLYRKDGSQVNEQPFVTGAEGKVTVEGLEAGEYYFQETEAPNGYEIEKNGEESKKYEFTITVPENGHVTEVSAGTVKNHQKPGSVEIEKLDGSHDNAAMQGVIFEVYKKNAFPIPDAQIGKIETGETGKGSLGGLDWGNYYLKEVTPEGYVKNETNYEFTISADQLEKSFTGADAIKNEVITGSVTLTKIDDTTKAAISGVEFKLYRKNTAAAGIDTEIPNSLTDSGNYITDSNGKIMVENLEYGHYYFTEVKAKAGYHEAEAPVEFEIKENGKSVSVEAANIRKSGSLVFEKQDTDGTALSGAEFTLYSRTNHKEQNAFEKLIGLFADNEDYYKYDIITVNEGKGEITGLPWDEYYLVETKAPQGYKLDNVTKYPFTINGDQLTGLIHNDNLIMNERQNGSVTLTKSDSENGKLLLPGATFELYLAGSEAEGPMGTYTTQEDGTITVPDLPWGTYYFVEIEAPEGYDIPENPESSRVTIDAKNANAQNEMVSQTVNVTNQKIKGAVKLTKQFKDSTGIIEDVEILKALYANVRFSLYRGDGSEVNPEPLMENIELGADGTVTIDNLVYGDYYFVETSSPAEFKLNSVPHKFSIHESSTEGRPIVAEVKVDNAKVYSSAQFTKVDTDGNEPIEGAVFGLYDSQGMIQEIVSNDDGIVKAENLGVGTYYFQELSNEGYEVGENPVRYYFVITKDSGTEVPVHAGSEQGEVIGQVSNTRLTGSITITKKGNDGPEKLLDGAEFALYKAADRENPVETLTTENGKVTFDGLAWGTYYVVETKAPYGYMLPESVEERTHEFTVGRTELNLTKDIVNTRIKGSVELTKKDADNEQLILSGAEFALFTKEGERLQQGLMTVNGILTVSGLDAGEYYFEETKAPVGYEIIYENEKPKKYGFTIDQASVNESVKVSVKNNRQMGSVMIYKADSETGEGLEGAKFELRRVTSKLAGLIKSTEVVNEYTTLKGGVLEINNLEWGTYELQEVEAPTGYILTKGAPIRFTINAENLKLGYSEQDQIIFENTKYKGSVQMIKKDQEEKAVEGAEFKLYRKNTASSEADTEISNSLTDNGNYITDSKGIIRVDNLSWGTYYFKEVKAPAGYAIKSEKTEETTISASNVKESIDSPLVIHADNTKIYGKVTLQKLDENSRKLIGAEFDLYAYTMGADGNITNPEFVASYAVSEAAGKEGSITVENLPYGYYYFEETKAPAGYNLDKTPVTFSVTEPDDVINLTFVNSLIKADVRFQKVDGVSGAGLNGAVFQLYQMGTDGSPVFVKEYTSRDIENESGIVLAENLGAGEYYFVEKTAPDGYILDQATRYGFTVSAEDNGTVISLEGHEKVSNTRKAGEVVLTKYRSGTEETLSGAVYSLYQMNGTVPDAASDILVKDGLTTAADGTVTVKELSWGKYYFVEQSAPEGYRKDETPILFTISAETDFTKAVEVRGENDRIPGKLSIEKVSSENSDEKLEGVEFELRSKEDNSLAATLKTDETGRASVEGLQWGTYLLTETKAAEGFNRLTDVIEITIDEKNLVVEFSGTTAITNTPIRGNVKVVKKDADDQKVLLQGAAFDIYYADGRLAGSLETGSTGEAVFENLKYGEYYLVETQAPQGYELPDVTDPAKRIPFSVSENNETVEVSVTNERILGSVTSVKTDNSGKELEGAVFTLYSRKNHGNSSILAILNAAVTGEYFEYGTYTTGQDGTVKFTGLPWDDYYLLETTAPEGYELNQTRYEFTIDELHLEMSVGTDGRIENIPLKGSVKLHKTDAADGKNLAGAVFELYQQKENGTFEKMDIEQALLTTDGDGVLTVTGLPWGAYYFKEVAAPTGYALNPDRAEFEITRENVEQSVEVPLNVQVMDTAFEIKVDKVDAETEESLSNAVLKLYHLEDMEAGRPAAGAKPVAEWTSKAGVPKNIGSLVNGGSRYVIVETKAPAGYTVAENLVFTVNADGTIETEGVVTEDNRILVQDVKYIPGTLTLTAGKELTGRTLKEGEFTFNLLDEQKNVVASTVNKADGSVVFNLENYYKETGEYDYTVVETDNGISGVTYDRNEYPVHVSVIDDGNGGLAVTVSYPDSGDGIVFKNRYSAAGSMTVTGTKQITGREFRAGDEFTFELLRDKVVVDTVTVKPEAGNSVKFTLKDNSLNETDASMTYTYEVREVLGGQTVKGVTFDGRVYKAEYKVTDLGDGIMKAVPVNEANLEQVVFTNTYNTGEAEFVINGRKNMTGRSFRTGDTFTFIAEKDGALFDKVTITPESGHETAFSFKADRYTLEDAGKSFFYTVYEEKGSISRVTYSDAIYKIVVTVSEDGVGNLSVSAHIDDRVFTGVEFTNSYTAPSDGDGGGGHNPDSNKPYVPGGPGDLVTVTPDEVPLVPAPSGGTPTDNLILIDDGNVPLAGLPKTGDRAAHAGLAALLSGILLAAFAALGYRKKEEESK